MDALSVLDRLQSLLLLTVRLLSPPRLQKSLYALQHLQTACAIHPFHQTRHELQYSQSLLGEVFVVLLLDRTVGYLVLLLLTVQDGVTGRDGQFPVGAICETGDDLEQLFGAE